MWLWWHKQSDRLHDEGQLVTMHLVELVFDQMQVFVDVVVDGFPPPHPQ